MTIPLRDDKGFCNGVCISRSRATYAVSLGKVCHRILQVEELHYRTSVIRSRSSRLLVLISWSEHIRWVKVATRENIEPSRASLDAAKTMFQHWTPRRPYSSVFDDRRVGYQVVDGMGIAEGRDDLGQTCLLNGVSFELLHYRKTGDSRCSTGFCRIGFILVLL
jgi:hypothetical protein